MRCCAYINGHCYYSVSTHDFIYVHIHIHRHSSYESYVLFMHARSPSAPGNRTVTGNERSREEAIGNVLKGIRGVPYNTIFER